MPPADGLGPTPQTGTLTPPARTPVGSTPLPALSFVLDASRASSKGVLTGRVVAAAKVPQTIRGTVSLTVGTRSVAAARFEITGTRSHRVQLRLTTAGRLVLIAKGTLRPLLRIVVTDPPNRVGNTLSRPTIRAPKRR